MFKIYRRKPRGEVNAQVNFIAWIVGTKVLGPQGWSHQKPYLYSCLANTWQGDVLGRLQSFETHETWPTSADKVNLQCQNRRKDNSIDVLEKEVHT